MAWSDNRSVLMEHGIYLYSMSIVTASVFNLCSNRQVAVLIFDSKVRADFQTFHRYVAAVQLNFKLLGLITAGKIYIYGFLARLGISAQEILAKPTEFDLLPPKLKKLQKPTTG